MNYIKASNEGVIDILEAYIAKRYALSKREQIAAMAMIGFFKYPNWDTNELHAAAAVKMADALIAELDK